MSISNLLRSNNYDLYANNVNTPNVDLITINHQAYPPGGGFLPIPVANKILRTNNLSVVSWGDVNPSNLTGGSVGDVLKTVAPSTVAWDTIKPGDITPGTARQLLQTNAGATAAQWTSNIDIPGTLDCTGNAVFDSDLAVTNDLNVINGDLTLANGRLSVLVDGISVEGNSAFNNALNIDGEITLNSVSGTANQTIVSDGLGNQIWSMIPASGINHGTANQLLVTNSLGTASQWSSSPTITGTLDIEGDLQIAASSGSSGNFVKKTGASTQAWSNLAASDIKGGTNNQVMISNGTNGTFSDNLAVVGTCTVGSTLGVTGVTTLSNNLIMNGSAAIFQMSGGSAVALLNDTRIYGPLKFSGIAGILGTVPVSDASGIPTWSYPTYFARYYDNNVVDMNNGGAGRTLLASASVDVANSNISYSAGTFTLAEAGTYQVLFKTNPTTVGAGAQSLINLKLNGAFYGSFTTIALAAGVQSAVLQNTFRVNTTNSTVEIVSQQLAAGVLNTSSTDSNGIATTVIVITRIGPYV